MKAKKNVGRPVAARGEGVAAAGRVGTPDTGAMADTGRSSR